MVLENFSNDKVILTNDEWENAGMKASEIVGATLAKCNLNIHTFH